MQWLLRKLLDCPFYSSNENLYCPAYDSNENLMVCPIYNSNENLMNCPIYDTDKKSDGRSHLCLKWKPDGLSHVCLSWESVPLLTWADLPQDQPGWSGYWWRVDVPLSQCSLRQIPLPGRESNNAWCSLCL